MSYWSSPSFAVGGPQSASAARLLPACVNCGAAEGKLCEDGWCPAAYDASQRSVLHGDEWREFAREVAGE